MASTPNKALLEILEVRAGPGLTLNIEVGGPRYNILLVLSKTSNTFNLFDNNAHILYVSR